MFFRQLEYLVTLARERHFARAARRCHVSQPALSQAIRNLEEELGVTIVRRGQRFLGFTPEGERILAWARHSLAALSGLRQEASAAQQHLSGLLRVGAVPTAAGVMALLTGACREAHPDLTCSPVRLAGLVIAWGSRATVSIRLARHGFPCPPILRYLHPGKSPDRPASPGRPVSSYPPVRPVPGFPCPTHDMPKQHPIHQQAQRIAKRLARNLAPQPGGDLNHLFHENPEWVMDSLQGLIDAHHRGSPDTECLTEAYSLLLGQQLELLRYRVDRGQPLAIDLARQFQQRVVGLVRQGAISSILLTRIAVLLRDAGLPPDPRLFETAADLMRDTPPPEDHDARHFSAMLAELAGEIGDEPFEVARVLTEITYAMPPDALASLADLVLSDPLLGSLVEAIPLMILDDRADVRRRLAQVIQKHALNLGPVSLRRLIAMRNWLFGDQRPVIDETIRLARRQGVDCASWPGAMNVEILASSIDGSGAQGFLLVQKEGRKYTVSSILTRMGKGILDAWSQAGLTKRERDRMLAQVDEQMPIQPISRAYLDLAVGHHLATALDSQTLPPIGLLKVAEFLGAGNWQPQRMDLNEGIQQLLRELPREQMEAAVVETVLKQSSEWAGRSGITESWFEDDQEVLALLSDTRSGQDDTLVQTILNRILAPRASKWAERCLWTSLWCKEGPGELRLLWPNFLLVARALTEGHPLEGVSLMSDIAALTVSAAGD